MKNIKKLLSLLFVSVLNADQYSFQLYNDFFAGTDQHFTNGIAISWLDNTFEHGEKDNISEYSKFLLNVVDVVPFRNLYKSKNYNAGASISQMIITPKDTSLTTVQYDDIPYAGYLALSVYLFEWDEKSFFESRMEFGVVGEDSFAKEVQNGFHSIIGSASTEGWDTQLGTEYILNALFRYGEISWKDKRKESLNKDWFNYFGAQLGNFSTNAFVGTMFRVGNNYIENFNIHYPYLREEASLLQLVKEHHGFGWSLSIGINGELLAYSYILDKGKEEGYSTSKRPFLVSLYTGIDLLYDVHKITYFYRVQSPYTYEQKKSDIFGGFMYSYQF